MSLCLQKTYIFFSMYFAKYLFQCKKQMHGFTLLLAKELQSPMHLLENFFIFFFNKKKFYSQKIHTQECAFSIHYTYFAPHFSFSSHFMDLFLAHDNKIVINQEK